MYRNTPLFNGYSPSQLSMGRKLKTRVPCHSSELRPNVPDPEVVRKREKMYRADMKANYDARHRVTVPGELSPGAQVWLPDMKTEGTMVGKNPAPRSYIVSTPSGLIRRNRRMVRGGTTPDHTPDNGKDFAVSLYPPQSPRPTSVTNQPSTESREPAKHHAEETALSGHLSVTCGCVYVLSRSVGLYFLFC